MKKNIKTISVKDFWNHTLSKKLLSILVLGVFTFSGNALFARGISLPENFTPPKAEDIIWLDSVSVLPLKVVFFPNYKPGNRSLFGNISYDDEIKITHFRYKIKDTNGAVLWEHTDDTKDLKKSFDFEIKPPIKSLVKNSELFVTAYEGKTVLGEGKVKIPLRNLKVGFNLSNLQIIEKDPTTHNAQFSFEGTPDSDLNGGIINIAVHSREGALMSTQQKSVILSRGNQRQVLSMDFKLPETPQLYAIKVFMQDENEVQIGGVLEKNILKKGAFAQLESLKVSVDKTTKPITFSLDFNGATTENQHLSAEVKIETSLEKEAKESFTENKNIQIIRTELFEDTFTFPLKKSADEFMIHLNIKYGDTIIGTKTLKYSEPIYVPGDVVIKEIVKNPIDILETPKNIWWKKVPVWLGIVAFLIIFAALDNWFKWHKKLFIFLFLILPFISVQNLQAVPSMVWWTHPVSSWYFNPNDTSKNFQKIQFKGSILSSTSADADPLFDPNPPTPNGNPTAILIHFIGPSSQDGYTGVSVDIPTDLIIEDNVRFIFELDLNTDTVSVSGSTQSLPSFLTDGVWQYEVLFCLNGGAGDPTCAAGQWYGTTARNINIDSTPPILTLNYDGAAQPLITSGIATDKSVISASQLAIKTATENKHTKEEEKKAKELLKTAKEKTLTKKTNLLSKKQERVTHLTEIIAKITEELSANTLLTQDQTTYLNNKKTSFQSTKSTLSNTEIPELTTQISTLTGEISTLTADLTQLQADIQGQTTILEDAESNSNVNLASFRTESRKHKKNFIPVSIACDDGIGTNCYTNPNYDLEVRGNFCDDTTVCDTTGTRTVNICDQVANCVDPNTHKNEIDWYDPLPPDLDLENSISNTVAGNNQIFSFNTTNTKDVRRDTTHANDSNDFNTHACGENPNSPLYDDGTHCSEKIVACATSATQRGTQDIENAGACATCPIGYIWDTGYCRIDCDQRNLELCLPGILGRDNSTCVEDGTWLPLTNTVPAPTPFLQVSKCGKLRQAIGTL